MDASAYMLIQGVSWVLLAMVTLGNGLAVLFNYRSISEIGRAQAANSRLSTLETTSAALTRRMEGVEGSNLSLSRKVSKAKFDALRADSGPEVSNGAQTTDPELQGIAPENRHLFERPN